MLLERYQSTPQQLTNGIRGRGTQRALPMLPGDFGISCAPMQISQHGVPQI
jgi:hypothetical protein